MSSGLQLTKHLCVLYSCICKDNKHYRRIYCLLYRNEHILGLQSHNLLLSLGSRLQVLKTLISLSLCCKVRNCLLLQCIGAYLYITRCLSLYHQVLIFISPGVLVKDIRCKPCIGFLAAISLVNCIDAATCCNMHLQVVIAIFMLQSKELLVIQPRAITYASLQVPKHCCGYLIHTSSREL